MSYLRRLFVANLTQRLDLSMQGISMLHVSICRLSEVIFLSLDDNECDTLPREIYHLANLTELSLQRNKLTSLPGSLGRMTCLEVRVLERTCIANLLCRACARVCTVLTFGTCHQRLHVDFNPTLKLLPPELSNASALNYIGYEGNELLSPGMEVLAKGVKPVLSYLNCLREVPFDMGYTSTLQ